MSASGVSSMVVARISLCCASALLDRLTKSRRGVRVQAVPLLDQFLALPAGALVDPGVDHQLGGAGLRRRARRPVEPLAGGAGRRQRRVGHAAAARPAAARPDRRAHRRPRARCSVGLYETVAEETEALADRLAACWHGDRADGRADGRGRRSPCRPGAQAAARHRRGAARARAAGGGRRPRRPARGARGLRRRRHAHRAGRPDAPATRSAGCSPAPGGGSARATSPRWRPAPGRWSALGARPGRDPAEGAGRRRPSRPPSAAASSRRSTTSAAPTPTRPQGYRRLRRLGARARPPAHPAGRVAARPGRRGRPHPGPGDRAGQRARAPAPAGARAHLDALHGVAAEFTELAELPSLPGLPRLPARRRGARAGPGAGRGGGQPGGGAAAHRALRQGPGVGRRRRSRHDQGPVPGQGRHQRLLDQGPRRRPRRAAAHRPRGAAAAAPAGARLRRPGGGEAGAGGLRPGVEGLRRRRGDPARLRRRHPRPAPAAVLGQLVARRQDGVRPLVAADHRAGRLRGRRRATSSHWADGAGGRRDQPGAGGVAGRAAGRPTR